MEGSAPALGPRAKEPRLREARCRWPCRAWQLLRPVMHGLSGHSHRTWLFCALHFCPGQPQSQVKFHQSGEAAATTDPCPPKWSPGHPLPSPMICLWFSATVLGRAGLLQSSALPPRPGLGPAPGWGLFPPAVHLMTFPPGPRRGPTSPPEFPPAKVSSVAPPASLHALAPPSHAERGRGLCSPRQGCPPWLGARQRPAGGRRQPALCCPRFTGRAW